MSGRQAKIITPYMLKRMLSFVRRTSSMPLRDEAIILLSIKAGLRACEIAKLDWSMVLDGRGRVGDVVHIRNGIAKSGSGRRVPMHPDLRRVLRRLQAHHDGIGPIIQSIRGGAMRSNSIVNWFVALYAELGFEGCSSHSGRRTFITGAARALYRTGGSLRDVQMLAGHRSIETTQGYIDGDTVTQRRLVALL